jgi:hypothetical protein
MSRYPKKPDAKKAPAKKKAAPKKASVNKRLANAKRKTGKAIATGRANTNAAAAAQEFVVAGLKMHSKAVDQLATSSMSSVNFSAGVRTTNRRYRFRDAITGLFLRARDALRRVATTVRESY